MKSRYFVFALSLFFLAANAFAQEGGNEVASEATPEATVPEAQAPAVDSEALPEQSEGTSVYGSAGYSFTARDKADSTDPWATSQGASLSFNLTSPSGLTIQADLSCALNTASENTVDSVIQQLFIGFVPTPWMSLTFGKQRLQWGTTMILSAIDIGEGRSNPLDQRSVLSGVSGMKVEILPLDWLGISFYMLPESDLRWSRYALRLDISIFDIGLDIGLGAIKYTYNPWAESLTISHGGTMTATPAVDSLDRIAYMLDFSQAIGDNLVINGEAQLSWGRTNAYYMTGMPAIEDYSADSRDQLIFHGALGIFTQIDIGLTSPMNFILEYSYRSDGLSESEANSFSARYITWKAAAPSPAIIPFSPAGSFRQHYLGLSLNSIAISRFLKMSGDLIAGLDSGFVTWSLGLNYSFEKGTSLGISWRGIGSIGSQVSGIFMTPYRNSISLSVSTGF